MKIFKDEFVECTTMEILKNIQRKIDYVTEPAQKLHVINKYLIDKLLTLREYPFDITIKILKVNKDASQLAAASTDSDKFQPGQKLSFYTLLAKYIQTDCTVKNVREDGVIIFQLDKLGIAKTNRTEPRIPNNGTMHASNMVTVKTVIDANMFQMPTLVKVAFDEFKNRFDKSKFEFVKIDIFKPDLPRRFNLVKKMGKPLLISDTSNRDSYITESTDRLSYERDIDEDIDAEIREFREDVIVSELIVPVLYGEKEEESFPMGYIWIQNRETPLNEEHLKEVTGIANQLVRRILESNTMTTEKKFPIIDASNSGILIAVEDETLMKILPKQRQVVLDIYFKMQPPFTVVGEIRWIAKKSDNKLLVGLKLESKSDMPGERMRYVRNLENLQRDVELEKVSNS